MSDAEKNLPKLFIWVKEVYERFEKEKKEPESFGDSSGGR